MEVKVFIDKESIQNNISVYSPQHRKIMSMLLPSLYDMTSAKESKIGTWNNIQKMLYPEISQEDMDNNRIRLPFMYWILQNLKIKVSNIFTKRIPILPLSPRSDEDVIPALAQEMVLSYQLSSTNFTTHFNNMLHDLFAFGMGASLVEWCDDVRMRNIYREQEINAPYIDENGVEQVQTIKQIIKTKQPVLQYSGNVVSVISPTRLLQDSQASFLQRDNWVLGGVVKLYNVQRAKEIAASEKWVNLQYALKTVDEYTGLISDSNLTLPSGILSGEYAKIPRIDFKTSQNIYAEYIYVKLTPSEWGLGDGDSPEIWQFIIINRGVIAKAEPMYYDHNEIPIVGCNYTGRLDEVIGLGALEFIMSLQNLSEWLHTTRVENIQRAIQGILFYNPLYLKFQKGLQENRIPNVCAIEPQSNLYNFSFDQVFRYVGIPDVTQSHFMESQNIFQLMKTVSGLQDVLLGIMPTKRTTTGEVGVALQQAGDFLLSIAKNVNDNYFTPMTKLLISNNKQYMNDRLSMRILGDYHRKLLLLSKQASAQFAQLKERAGISFMPPSYWFANIDNSTISGNYDYDYNDILNGINSERLTTLYMQLLGFGAQNPEFAKMFDIQSMLRFVMHINGVREDFSITPEERDMIQSALSGVIKETK